MIRAAALAALVAMPATAQEAVPGSGVVLRALDKLSGRVEDLEIPMASRKRFGRIEIDLAECRFPTGNPAGDAYALLRVRDTLADRVVYTGWMIASAPALSALDHARYDVWVLRCTEA